MDAIEFRPGDHLLVSCEPHRAVVASADRHYVYVRWPWHRLDPESAFRWDGTNAFARDPKNSDFNQLWQLDPPPAELQEGDLCEILVPPTEVVVTWAARFDPLEDTGWLPRPTGALRVVPVFGKRHPHGEDEAKAGVGLYVDDAEPLEIQRLGRLPVRA
ncbi:hypothetical protein [Dactylosporangium darangshiense]|uniref:Uncharacterized protein n=1 Tax=Dactylosporangium darangshiense TaxID=579108 RepID=A0ABP8DVY9_9ACTN